MVLVVFGMKYLNTEHLVYMDEETPVCFADSYWYMNAVVSESGNVYIRGILQADDYSYGIPNVKEFNAQFQSLNFEKTERFVQIYDVGDARTVTLSSNGGVIITDTNDVYVFSESEKYRLPTFLCTDAVSAMLESNKVLLLNDKGEFGYIELSAPDNRITVLVGIESFGITDQDHSIWVLNNKHELWVYLGGDLTSSPVLCHSDVLAFDVVSTKSFGEPNPHYQIAIIGSNGTAYYYDAWGLPSVHSTDVFIPLPVDSPADVAVYCHGVITLDKNGIARVFGDDLLSDRKFKGDVIAENVRQISAGSLGINFVTYDGQHIYAGSLPSSKLVELGDIR